MLIVPGYTVLEQLNDTAQSAVFTGMRRSDGRAVVLKLYRERQGRSSARAEHEVELLQRIRSDHVVRVLELCRTGEGAVVVFERFAGPPLTVGPRGRALPAKRFLAIAIGAARALADVHAARVIHKDVKPDNLLFDVERGRTCLVDFGIAAEFGRAESSVAVASAEGTFAYISPEQTGRTGRGLDFRTDLYSLGATLYELLTGTAPFEGQAIVDLILAHLALRPRPAIDVEPRTPPAISRIVEKLLEKDPELRYQTAQGLAADLETCLKQLDTLGEIDPELVLGAQDASDRLRFPNRLYGRERERATLLAALEVAAHGKPQWVLLSGPAGIGKSSLAGVLREPLTRRSGLFAEAKFEVGRRERPYAGIATVVASAVDQLLTASEARIERWRDRLRSQLGNLGAVLVELVPNLGLLIADFPPAPRLGAREHRERLELALLRFVRALAHPSHPVLLFFDDLQWADEGSAGVLEALFRDPSLEALLVVVGYRDDAESLQHPMVRSLREQVVQSDQLRAIELGPLGIADTTALLADALARPAAELEGLAHLAGQKCDHNPLLVRRMLFHLWDLDLLRYEHGVGWRWDEQQIREAEITDDAAQMIASRVDRLPEDSRQLIAIASLIGSVFDVDLLAILAERDAVDVHQRVVECAELGLMAPCREGFKFSHDRIREAAQGRLSDGERARLHHRAARILMERADPAAVDACAFQIAEHLSRSLGELGAAERKRATAVFRVAGQRALGQGAYDTAAVYLERARELLEPADEREDSRETFALYLDEAEAALQQRRYDHATQLLDALDRRPLSRIEIAQVEAKRIMVHSLRGDPDPVERLLAALARLGIRWSRHPSKLERWLEILWTDWRIRELLQPDGEPEKQIPARAKAASRDWLAPILVTSAAAPRLSLYSAPLVYKGWALSLRAVCAHPGSMPLAMLLASYAGTSITLRRNPVTAERYSRAAAYWIERCEDPLQQTRARMVLESLVNAWIRPRRSVVEPLEQVAEAARELGDRQFVSFSLHAAAGYAALSGEALPRVAERVTEILEGRVSSTHQTAHTMQRAYDLLRISPAAAGAWESRCETLASQARGGDTAEDLYGLVHVIVTLCLAGAFEHARALAERFWAGYMESGALGPRLADLCLYRGLAEVAATEAGSRTGERLRARRILRACARKLRAFARHGSDFVHMHGLLEAEAARAQGRDALACRRYHLAAQAAQAAGYVQHAALCNERRADLLARRRRHVEAQTALTSAIQLYRAWGAVAKADHLEQVEQS